MNKHTVLLADIIETFSINKTTDGLLLLGSGLISSVNTFISVRSVPIEYFSSSADEGDSSGIHAIEYRLKRKVRSLMNSHHFAGGELQSSTGHSFFNSLFRRAVVVTIDFTFEEILC